MELKKVSFKVFSRDTIEVHPADWLAICSHEQGLYTVHRACAGVSEARAHRIRENQIAQDERQDNGERKLNTFMSTCIIERTPRRTR